MNEQIKRLKSVLCDPEGIVCIQGSDADRAIVQDAMEKLGMQVDTMRQKVWLDVYLSRPTAEHRVKANTANLALKGFDETFHYKAQSE